MKQGRELDKCIALDVLALTHENGFYVELDCPHYSTDIRDAWEVVDYLDLFLDNVLYQEPITGEWVIEGMEGSDLFIHGKSPAHVICLAALKVKGL